MEELQGTICDIFIDDSPIGLSRAVFVLAYNAPQGEISYIPCLARGSNADKVKRLKTGQSVSVKGRYTNRVYFPNGEVENIREFVVLSF